MKEAQRILSVLGQVDEKYAAEAATGKKAEKKPTWIRWTSVAACLVLIVSLLIGALKGGWLRSSDVAELDNGNTIIFVKCDSAGGSLSLDRDVNTRELTAEEVKTMFGDLPVTAFALFNAADDELIGVDGKIGDMKLIITTSGLPLTDTVVEGIEKNTVVDGVSVIAGYYLTDPNSRGEQTAIYFATFELGSSTVYVENAGARAEREKVKNDLAAVVQELINNGEPDTSQLH